MSAVAHLHPAPNRAAVLAQLEHLFGNVAASEDGLVEVAWTARWRPHSLVHARLFPLDDLDEIAATICETSSVASQNVYVSAGLRRSDAKPDHRATKAEVTKVTALWVDFDDEGAAAKGRQRCEELGIPPTLVVQTGTFPHQRAQGWWALEEPLEDLALASRLVATLAAALGGDPAVSNVDRVMRAAGSVAWPLKAGRRLELVELLEDWASPRPPYAAAEIERALASVAPTPRAVMPGPRPSAREHQPRTSYALAALEAECRAVASCAAGQGLRNKALNTAAFNLGTLVGAGELQREGAAAALWEAAETNGYVADHGDVATRGTIESGLGAGERKPREVPASTTPGQIMLQPHALRAPAEEGPALASSPDELFLPSGFTGELPPPRPWAYGDFLLSGAVTGIAAPPGVGKTTFSVQLGIAFALDLEFGPWTPRAGGGGHVWLFNGEEPMDELDRRFIAACRELDVDERLAAERFRYNSGLAKGPKLSLLSQGAKERELIRSPHVELIKRRIVDGGFRLFIVDPLVEFHSVREVDLEAIKEVASILREIATDCECAVLAFHHTPKTATSETRAGDMNAMRGGGPLIGVVRFVQTMFGMSAADAETLGIPARDRSRYIRIDGAKANMGPLNADASWWERLGVGIDNADDVRPQDVVGVLRHRRLSAPGAVTELDRARELGSLRSRIAAEVIRVCELNGHTSAETAAVLDGIMKALDPVKTGVKATKARDVVVGQFGAMTEYGGYRIVVQTLPRGGQTVRRVHVEPIEGGGE